MCRLHAIKIILAEWYSAKWATIPRSPYSPRCEGFLASKDSPCIIPLALDIVIIRAVFNKSVKR